MSNAKPILNLKQFMLRQQVLALYRQIFRAIREVPSKEYQQELRQWARSDFRANPNQTDEITVRMRLSYGQRCLNELRSSLCLAK